MDDFNDAFIMGMLGAFIISLLIAITISINIDMNFNSVHGKHLVMIELCEKLDSVPHSYDDSELTCENSMVLDYKLGGGK